MKNSFAELQIPDLSVFSPEVKKGGKTEWQKSPTEAVETQCEWKQTWAI